MHCSQVSWALRLGLRSARWGIKRHPAPLSAAYPKIKTVPSARVRVNLIFMVSILIIQGKVAVLADLITSCFQGVIRVGTAVAMHRAVAIKDRLRWLQGVAGHVGHAAGAGGGGRDAIGLSGLGHLRV